MSREVVPLLVKVWAGTRPHDFRYIVRSLASLRASDLPPSARVVLADDASTDRRVAPLLARCAREDARFEVWTNPENLGPDSSHAANFARLVERFPDAAWYGNCDDDVIYHPGWLQRLLAVAAEARARGIEGVFTALNVPFRPARSSARLPTSEVLLKERQAALNWLVPRAVLERVGPFRAAGVAFDSDYCDRMAALGIPVVCLRPSWVQNIGYEGAYQHDDRYRADDYVGRRDAWLFARDQAWRLRRLVEALAR